MGDEREFLEKASDNYFAAYDPGVRRYTPAEITFQWLRDVWPYYRQTMEHNYAGPQISED